MSEGEAQRTGTKGPLSLGGPPAATSPSMLAPAPPTRFAGATGSDRGANDVVSARYSRNGVSPIPFMVISFVAMFASWWAMAWSKVTSEATDPVRTSEWWVNITSVLLPGEDLRAGSFSTFRMQVTLAILIVTAIAVAVWIGRLGTNLRTAHNPFGSFLPLATYPAWWLLPITIGITADDRTRGDAMLRYLIAFGILFAQFLLLRWPVTNRIWRAGRLPYDLASIVLWLPMMIPWSMLFISNVYTFLVIGETGPRSDSSWLPTSTMRDWARWTTRASGIGLLILLVVVSVMQELGMRRDRAEAEATRGTRPTLPAPPPGI